MPRGVVEAVEEKPVEGVLMTMNVLGWVFVATALAAGIAWIVYVAKAVKQDVLGKGNGQLLSGTPGLHSADGQTDLNTAEICFQAAVVSVLFYFVARHHFSHMHF